MIIVMKWATVAAYWATAVVCILRAKKPNLETNRRKFWWGAAMGMFLLGINKQQDAIGWFTQALRSIAWRDNWFFARQPVQLLFIAVGVIVVFALSLALIWFLRPARGAQWLALAGIVYLLSFVFVRAVSFHAIDIFLYRSVSGIQLNWAFELGGIAIVAGAGLLGRRA